MRRTCHWWHAVGGQCIADAMEGSPYCLGHARQSHELAELEQAEEDRLDAGVLPRVVELQTRVDSIWHLLCELHKSEATWAAGKWTFVVEVGDKTVSVHAILPSFKTPFENAETVALVHDTFLRAYKATVGP